jgi:hypothetical protein
VCKVIYNSITNVKELGKRLNNYYKLFTFWSEIHALSRFRRVSICFRFLGPFWAAFCPLFLTNMADFRQVAARSAHAARPAPEAHVERCACSRMLCASQSRCAAYGALACVATRMQQSRCALAYVATRMQQSRCALAYVATRMQQSRCALACVATRMQQNARREPESLRGVRRSSVRRDTDAAEPMRPRVRRDADAFRRMHAAESLRPRVRRRRGCFPKSAGMPRSRSRCALAYVGDADAFRRVHACRAAEFRRATFVSMPESRARSMVRAWLGAAHPSPLIPSPIYGIIYEFSDFWAQFWTIFKSTRPPSKS